MVRAALEGMEIRGKAKLYASPSDFEPYGGQIRGSDAR